MFKNSLRHVCLTPAHSCVSYGNPAHPHRVTRLLLPSPTLNCLLLVSLISVQCTGWVYSFPGILLHLKAVSTARHCVTCCCLLLAFAFQSSVNILLQFSYTLVPNQSPVTLAQFDVQTTSREVVQAFGAHAVRKPVCTDS